MSTAQIIQTLGFFWLAATGLLLRRRNTKLELSRLRGSSMWVAVYLIGRNWKLLKAPLEPWKLILVISAIALFARESLRFRI